jgi:hypothetical protein
MRISNLLVYLCYGLEGKVVYVQVIKAYKGSKGLTPLILKAETIYIYMGG